MVPDLSLAFSFVLQVSCDVPATGGDETRKDSRCGGVLSEVENIALRNTKVITTIPVIRASNNNNTGY